MSLVGQLAHSVSLTPSASVAVTGEDDGAGTVNKALALLTRYFPAELVAPYAAITAVLPAIKPSPETISTFAEKRPPVLPADVPPCNYEFDGRLGWYLSFAILALVSVPLLNATRDTQARWKIVIWIDAPIALVAFLLWGAALPDSPLESVCGDQVNAIQVACAVLGAFLVPALALALKNTLGKRWA